MLKYTCKYKVLVMDYCDINNDSCSRKVGEAFLKSLSIIWSKKRK